MFNPFKRKRTAAEPWQDADSKPSGIAEVIPDPDADVSIFEVGQRITINGLPFRVERFGAHLLVLRLEGKGKLVWRKRPARRAKARRNHG